MFRVTVMFSPTLSFLFQPTQRACYYVRLSSDYRQQGSWQCGGVQVNCNDPWDFFLSPKYRVSQEECAILRESVPYVKLYRYNPKHLYPKLNGYGDNGQISLKLWQLLHTYWLPNTYWNWQEYVVYVMLISVHNIKVTCEWHKAIKLNYKNSRTNTRGCLLGSKHLHI